MNHLTRTRTVLGLVAAASMIVLSACGSGSDSSESSGASDKDAAASGSPSVDASGSPDGPDLTGIPDVVAEVNGEEVTKEEFVPIFEAAFQQAAAQAQTTGEAPDEEALRQETADNLISAELLAQEAESRGIEVSDEDVDAELTRLAEENQLASADELLAAVAQNGLSEEQARAQVETQVLVEQLVADESGGQGPTEQELRAVYAQAKERAAGQEGQKIPPYAEVRDQLEEQARTEQTSKVANALVADLRKDADITINL